jgi:MFS family permease
MSSSSGVFHLLGTRRFLPLFGTQMLGAFNDNLFKHSVVLFVVYEHYQSEQAENWFSALTTALFTLPFFILSAVSGQLADSTDKAKIIRIVKTCEIGIMIVGAGGLMMARGGIMVDSVAIPILLLSMLAMGIHSTFFGPIKYAILPQHLEKQEVLGGTGLVEAGTYVAILGGTLLAGLISVELAATLVLSVALIGWVFGRAVPPAPPLEAPQKLDWNIFTASARLVKGTLKIRRLFLAIISISFFWTIGAVLFIQFPALVKNALTADKAVASVFLAIFSIGVAIGSLAVNRLLKGEVSARYSPVAVIIMGLFVFAFYWLSKTWELAPVELVNGTLERSLYNVGDFLAHPGAIWLSLALLGIAIFGGIFVVPLYAFLTTTVKKSEAARTVAANNIVNAGFMVVGTLLTIGLTALDIGAADQLLLAAGMCIVSAWLAWMLHRACDHPLEPVVESELPTV